MGRPTNVFFLCSFLLASQTLAAIPPSERAALIALYNSTNGDGWTDKSGWKTPPLDTDGFAMPALRRFSEGIKTRIVRHGNPPGYLFRPIISAV